MHPCGSHAIIGKKGGGKSMLAVRLMLRILGETKRTVITNLPLRLSETQTWMENSYPLWSQHAPKSETPLPECDVHSRIVLVEDARLLKRFWLYRGHRWTIPDVPKEDWAKGRRLDYRMAYRWRETLQDVSHRTPVEDLTISEIKIALAEDELESIGISQLPAVQYIIDELQNIFPARSFQQTSQGGLFWLSQQRHLGDDFIWITQSPELVDKEFRDLTDDWLYITNWGRKRKSIFRLPKVMTWAKYDQRPGPGVSPMVQGTFRMDTTGIGQLYDTSAGVGIEGGLVADTKEGIGGIHWSWIVLVVALLLWGVFKTPRLITKAISHLFVKPAPTMTVAPPQPSPQTNAAHATSSPPAPVSPPQIGSFRTNFASRPLHLVGLTVAPGSHIATAWLSDGTRIDSTDASRFGGLLRSGARIAGCRIDGQPLYLP